MNGMGSSTAQDFIFRFSDFPIWGCIHGESYTSNPHPLEVSTQRKSPPKTQKKKKTSEEQRKLGDGGEERPEQYTYVPGVVLY